MFDAITNKTVREDCRKVWGSGLLSAIDTASFAEWLTKNDVEYEAEEEEDFACAGKVNTEFFMWLNADEAKTVADWQRENTYPFWASASCREEMRREREAAKKQKGDEYGRAN